MNIVTIPKKLAQKDDLVVVPRKEYEALLRWRPKLIPVVKLTRAEILAIEKSERELAQGDYVTLDELEHALGNKNTKKR